MTNRTRTVIILVALTQGLWGCGGSTFAVAPTAERPSPSVQAPFPGGILTGVTLFGVVSEGGGAVSRPRTRRLDRRWESR